MGERKKNSYGSRGKKFTHPLERGWAGGRPLGRKFGPPLATNKEVTFDNFETILLEFKTVYHMTGNLGRVRRNSILMCTGNGCCGFHSKRRQIWPKPESFEKSRQQGWFEDGLCGQVRGPHSVPRLLHPIWVKQDLCPTTATRIWHQSAQSHQSNLSDVWNQ